MVNASFPVWRTHGEGWNAQPETLLGDTLTPKSRHSDDLHVMESRPVDLISCMVVHAVEIQMLGLRLPISRATPRGYGGCGRCFPPAAPSACMR